METAYLKDSFCFLDFSSSYCEECYVSNSFLFMGLVQNFNGDSCLALHCMDKRLVLPPPLETEVSLPWRAVRNKLCH